MNKKLVWAIVGLLLMASIVGIIFWQRPVTAPPNSAEMVNMSTIKDTRKQDDTSPVATDKLVIKNFAYSHKVITIKKGTTVIWTNQDTVEHNVVPDTLTDDFKASSLLAQGESYSMTFKTPGTYKYHCSPHPYMTATVIVTE